MKKILVTGAGGFIGSHLTETLVKSGYTVKAFVRYNSKSNRGWLEDSPFIKDIEVVSGDIRDYDSVINLLSDCDSVFHLAALIGIPYSYISPLAYIKTNIEGTYNVLQSSLQLGLENVIITSTSENYGTAKYIPIDEEHPLNAQSPYSASKIAADQLALSYYRSYNLPLRIVRPFNVYGPRQSARAIIPTVISQILSKNSIIKVGNVNPTRDFTFVHDTVSGFIEVARSSLLLGEITNIGMNHEISIADLINLIIEIMEKETKVEFDNIRIRPEKSEVERLKCDNTKLLKSTKWSPDYDLKTGLISTIKWFRDKVDLYKSEIYNV